MTIGDLPNEPISKGLDWNRFLGPTPLRPHNRRLWVKEQFKVGDLLWRGWDLYRDYSGHIMTNWGAHTVDMVQYALGKDDTGPVEVQAVPLESTDEQGQRWKDKTPLPQSARERRFWPVVMRYADGVEVRFMHGSDFIRFYGERGVMTMRRNYFETDPPGLVQHGPDASVAEKWKGGGHVARPHLENWLDAIRFGTALNAPVEAGHRTATICHLANLTRELGRPLAWIPQLESFQGDDQAQAQLDRPRRVGFELPEIQS